MGVGVMVIEDIEQLPEPRPDEIQALCDKLFPVVSPLLANQHPSVQGGALADLVATWIAGHFVQGYVPATRGLRAALLSDFLMSVERLVPVCAEEIGAPHDPITFDPDTDADPFARH